MRQQRLRIAMTYRRLDVWKLGAGWSDNTLWYAKAVAEMKRRPIADRTSWRFLAGMHGIEEQLWRAFTYIKVNDVMPSAADQKVFWRQCQHQTWFFLPWHRGYLAAFEAIVRDTIVKLGGPANWALPYWNYNDVTNPNATKLPPCFGVEKLPDGTPNPLYTARRYGNGGGVINMPPAVINLNALNEPVFTGSAAGGTTGFGGPATLFSHDGQSNGQLESRPHNAVHGLVGGRVTGSDPDVATNYGLMSNPDTAALDPIFWVHHANIDRLWEVWLRRDPKHKNTVDPRWTTGPANRKFLMPDTKGNGYGFTPSDMLDTLAPNLNYVYEDVTDPLHGGSQLQRRLLRLNVPERANIAVTEVAMTKESKTELLGANATTVRLQGKPVSTTVRMDEKVALKTARSLTMESLMVEGQQEPDRVYLNLENIRGNNDATIFYVYVNVPADADPKNFPGQMAGAVSLFGVQKASRIDEVHSGNGINEVLDITDIIDTLHLSQKLDFAKLDIRFVPHTEIGENDKITVGRVSIYRRGN
jgi:tyrosinase